MVNEFKIGDRVRATWAKELTGSVASFNPPVTSGAEGHVVGILWDWEQRTMEEITSYPGTDYLWWYAPDQLEAIERTP